MVGRHQQRDTKGCVSQRMHRQTRFKALRSLSLCPCGIYIDKIFMSKVYNWFNERLEIQAIADDVTSKYVPPHVNIFYCLGGITLTCFLVQVATGFAMTFYYRPNTELLLYNLYETFNDVFLFIKDLF